MELAADVDVLVAANLEEAVALRVLDDVVAVVVVRLAQVEARVLGRRPDVIRLLVFLVLALDVGVAARVDDVPRVVLGGHRARVQGVRHGTGDEGPVGVAAPEGHHHLGALAEGEVEALRAAPVRLHHADGGGALPSERLPSSKCSLTR